MELDYKLIYSKRTSVTITVERDGSIVVRAPEGLDAYTVRQTLESKKLWLYKKLQHPQKFRGFLNKKEFVSGETVLYLGRNYRLEVQKGSEEGIRFVGKFVVTGVTRERAHEVFKDWYIQKARETITQRVAWYAHNLGVHFNAATVADFKHRWGACTPKNNLKFNWKLIKAPLFVIDYVIVHELAHLLEGNHTRRFWNIVKIQVAGYLKARGWLKQHGEILETDF